jgi:outer membrane protein TolC
MLAAGAATPQAGASDLRSFLQAADEYNLDHRISLETRERAVWEFHQAWTSLLPVPSASGVFTHNQYDAVLSGRLFGRTDDVVLVAKNGLDLGFRVDLPLIDTARWMRIVAASAGRDGAEERELVMRDLIRRQVVAAYYGYAAALALQESSQKSLGVAEEQLRLTDIRAKAGSATELELLRASAEMQRNRQVVTDTASMVATSRRTLRTLSGVEPPALVPLPVTDRRPEPGFEELEQQVEVLPSVRAADRDLSATEANGTAARLGVVPTLGFAFNERFTTAPGLNGGHDTLYNYTVNLSWRIDAPTLVGYGVQAHAEAAARLAAEKSRVQARDQIHSDWQRFNAGLQKVEAAEAQVQAATRAAQVSRDKYAVGAATQLDVIQSERDVFSAEVGQIQARTELAGARASLRISAGKPVLAD